jgi:hypothetical protein
VRISVTGSSLQAESSPDGRSSRAVRLSIVPRGNAAVASS